MIRIYDGDNQVVNRYQSKLTLQRKTKAVCACQSTTNNTNKKKERSFSEILEEEIQKQLTKKNKK